MSEPDPGEPGPLTRALMQASAHAQEQHEKEVRDKLIKLHSDVYSSAAAYDNGVILAGYVAFFALWAGSSDDVSRLCRLVTIALMGTSLMLYMGWHILQMLTRQRFEWKLADAFKHAANPKRFNREWTDTNQQLEIAVARLMRFWPWIFIPAVGLGFLGAGVLSFNALAITLGWPQLAR